MWHAQASIKYDTIESQEKCCITPPILKILELLQLANA